MRVVVVGAGAVGKAIAEELLDNGHRVLIIEQLWRKYCPHLVPRADWMLADACEMGTLDRAGIRMCDAAVAATGDDKANLVFALLAKTHCHVPRVVARVNDVDNRWLFGPGWGVDVALSTPATLVALVEEAVTVGNLVELMTLQQGHGTIVAITLSGDSPFADRTVREVSLPSGAAIIAVRRDGAVAPPEPDRMLRAGDEVVLAASQGVQETVRARLRPR